MGSFSKGIKTTLSFRRTNGIYVYSTVVDRTWSVRGIPHGGYLLSVVLNALNSLQSNSKPFHPDPAHLTATFLRAAQEGSLEVECEIIKTGRNWTNISVRVVQNGLPIILAQALYTLLPPLPTTVAPFSTSNQNLLPSTPSPYSYKSPFLTHPSLCSTVPASSEEGRRWTSKSIFWFLPDNLLWSEDPALKQKREGTGEENQLVLEWGAWMQFTAKEDKIDIASLGFFADMMSSIPELLPPGQVVEPHYYPTLAMSMQFHAKLPLPSTYLTSPQTIGCYSKGNLIHEGRHEQLTEVWTAPSEIGSSQNGIQENWREKSMILITATQIALSVPLAGMKNSAPPPSKL